MGPSDPDRQTPKDGDAGPESTEGLSQAETRGETDDTAQGDGAERPRLVGRYRLLEVIGEGGMGTVWLAEQTEPVRRRVALKVIKPGMDTRQVVARFQSERQALALMEHPNIATVLDAGATLEGHPYFVMEFVPGVRITAYCDEHRLSIRQRLDLFLPVCRAIEHAHQKGLIHRDIKPGNILVSESDGKPTPKVIDFGVAKATDHAEALATAFTQAGVVVGTPAYMSPEQAEPSLDIDTRSDVYSLGVVLYELLVGAPPFDTGRLRRAAFEEMFRVLREQDPPRLSTRLTSLGEAASDVALKRGVDPQRLNQDLRGDLDWITAKSLEKDRERRYPTASALAADLARHLADEPVEARPPSLAYTAVKLARKHRGAVAAIAMVTATFLVMGSLALWQGLRAQQRAHQVRAASLLAVAGSAEDPLLAALLASELRTTPDSVTAQEILQRIASSPIPLSERRCPEVMPSADLSRTPLGLDFSGDGTLVGITCSDSTARIWRTDGTGGPVVLAGHDGHVRSLAFDADGRRVVTASADGTARIWHLEGASAPVVLEGHSGAVMHAEFSSTGALVLTTSADGIARVWDSSGAGAPVVLGGGESGITAARFGRAGDLVVTGSRAGDLRVWRLDGLPVASLGAHAGAVNDIRFSPLGDRLVTASEDGTARIWDLEGRAAPVVLRGHRGPVRTAVFGPDSSLVLTASSDGTTRLWRPGTQYVGEILADTTGEALMAAFSTDGDRAIAANADGSAWVWTLSGERPAEPMVLAGHVGRIWSAAFDPGGDRVATLDQEGVLRVWPSVKRYPLPLTGHSGRVTALAFIDTGNRLISGGEDGTALIWDAESTEPPTLLAGHSGSITSIDVASGGDRVGTASKDGTARMWAIDAGNSIVLSGHDGSLTQVRFDADARRIATAGEDGTVRVWSAEDGSLQRVLDMGEGPVRDAAFNASGSHIAAATERTVEVWSTSSGERSLSVEVGNVVEFGFHPTGDSFLVATPGDVRVWSIDEYPKSILIEESKAWIKAARFSRDGSQVLVADDDGGIRIWSADGDTLDLELAHEDPPLGGAIFSQDGRWIVTYGWFGFGDLRVWPASGGAPLVLRSGGINSEPVAIKEDGTLVAAGSLTGQVLVWRTDVLPTIRSSTTACLRPEDRMLFLGETQRGALRTYEACESRHGRALVSND